MLAAALAKLGAELDATDTAVDFAGQRFEFHQPLPPGLLAVVLSRCATLCGAMTSIWRTDLATIVVDPGSRAQVEVCIGQPASNSKWLTIR